MNTTDTTRTIPAELMAELQEAADRAAKGIRDPEEMRKACESMDQRREEIRKRHAEMNSMNTLNGTGLPPDAQADFQAIIDSVTSGKPLDPQIARRVGERAEKVRQAILATHGVQDIGTQIIREMRGPLDEDQERELTLAQRALLHKGDARLVDPDTGSTYVLVREDEYERLRNK